MSIGAERVLAWKNSFWPEKLRKKARKPRTLKERENPKRIRAKEGIPKLSEFD